MALKVSLAKNYLFAMASSISQIAFPLITFPYVSRILGPSGMGAYNFANSIVAYFVLLSALGISIYGQRLVATKRDDKPALSSVFSTLSTLHLVSTLIWFCVYLVMLIFLKKFHEEFMLNLIAAGVLLANVFSFEWFFKGVEDFKYIAIRSFIVRALLLILIFILVRREGDELMYMSLTVLSAVVPYIYNAIRIKEYAKFDMHYVRFREIKEHLLKMIPLSVYALLTNAYTVFPVVLLGFVSTNYSVGVFTVAQRICLIVLTIFSTASAVLFPRMAHLSLFEDKAAFNNAVIRSVEITVPIATTLSVYLYFFANPLVSIIAGGKYKGCVDILRILSPVITLVAIAQICVSQLMLPRGDDIKVLKRTGVVAGVGLVMNFVLIHWKPVIGASISVLCSEFLMTGLLMTACWESLGGRKRWNGFIVSAAAMVAGMVVIRTIVPDSFSVYFQIAISAPLVSALFALIYAIVLRNPTVRESCKMMISVVSRRRYNLFGGTGA